MCNRCQVDNCDCDKCENYKNLGFSNPDNRGRSIKFCYYCKCEIFP